MALDTQSKRLSAIFAGAPWRTHLPKPDASLDQGDRQHLVLWCSAVLFEAGVSNTVDYIRLNSILGRTPRCDASLRVPSAAMAGRVSVAAMYLEEPNQ